MKKKFTIYLLIFVLISCNKKDDNSNPSAFEITDFSRFQGCGGFLDQQERIMFNITEPNDSDGDEIKYEINYGGEISILPSIGTTNLRGDIAAQSINGEIRYNLFAADLLTSDFPDLTNEENVELIVTAKDGNGGESIASMIYNVNSTDLDLGTIPLPFSNTFNFDEEIEVIDKKIEIKFNLISETNFSIKVVDNDNDAEPRVRMKETGEIMPSVNTEPNTLLFEGILPTGNHTIILDEWLFPSGMSGVCIPFKKLGKGNITIDFEEN